MTVKEAIGQLSRCPENDEVVVPCFRCGEAEAEALLLKDHDGCVVIMCKACSQPFREPNLRW